LLVVGGGGAVPVVYTKQKIMEPKWLMVVLFRGLTLFVVFGE